MSLKTSPSKAEADADAQKGMGMDYWQLFRDLPEPYLLFEASDPTYRVIETNKARDELAGVPREACVGRSLFDVYPYTNGRFTDTVAKDLREQLRQIIRTGRSQQLEPISFRRYLDDNSQQSGYLQVTYYPLRDTAGKVRYILAVTRDVSEGMRAAERAATIESRLAAALTIGKVSSWVFEPTTGRIVGDENLRKLFKMPKQRARSYNLQMFLGAVYPGDRARVTAAIKRSLRQHIAFEEEFRVRLSDGALRWILARAKPEAHSDGSVTFPGVVVDLTEQRDLRKQIEIARRQDQLNQQAARVLQQRNEELEAISRSKDEFVALASHQLRTPATAVKQYISMMLQGYVGEITDMQVDVLQKAFESNERQIQIISQILSAARADTGRLTMTPMPLDLCSLLRSIAADMDGSLRQRGHTLITRLPTRPLHIAADLGHLRMAIENIVQNANVYTPEGGTIAIRLKRDGERALLSITDTGVGIDEKDIGRLFVKFSRIDNPLSVEAGGSGIGLYLTAEIVRLHGGKIDVKSDVGKGTTFAISLPLVQNKTTLASGVSVAKPGDRKNPQKPKRT